MMYSYELMLEKIAYGTLDTRQRVTLIIIDSDDTTTC